MGKCLYCGNLSKNKNKASLHRFPQNAALREQWIKFIGRENWMPKNSSYLCSDHFRKDCFNVHYSNRKCLKPGSLPTISTYQETFQEHSNILVESNHGNINESITTSDEVPEVGVCIEYIDSPTSSREIFDEESYLQSSISRMNVTESQRMTVHENIHHDHHYERTLTSTLKKLSSVQRRLDSSLESNKMLKRQLKQLKIKLPFP
ncbi:THAP domain-containing protein 5-like isoform X2 [Lasioglossum baleicum]|uniref:THAP domain-containing protein 5-like isoform X2 n=1 Tax=Lasioglossum baleicum TaxID=434251 RepID=UPI003FCEAF77